MTTATNLPAGLSIGDTEADAGRRRRLRRMRLVALSLLVVAAVIFVLTHEQAGWLGYVNAGAEAGMIGAIADWFAVTALFRHPLGLPIPHTAIIPRRKETLGASLQEFVTENFLRSDVVRERILSAGLATRLGAWLADERHAQRVVDEGSRMAARALARVRPDDVSAVVTESIIPRLLEEPLSPAAGQALAEVVGEGAHVGLVDLTLDELHAWLVRNAEEVAALVTDRAPWWTPQWVDERVAVRLHGEALAWVQEIRDDPDHRARKALDRLLVDLADDLQHDADVQQRAERLKRRVLSRPQVARTSVAIWDALRRALIGSLEDEQGLLRQRALEELRRAADRLQTDAETGQTVDGLAADAAGYVVDRYGSEVATIISATVNRWDGKETAQRIELHVGRDLQFIRINGTIVGALVGITIHGLVQLL